MSSEPSPPDRFATTARLTRRAGAIAVATLAAVILAGCGGGSTPATAGTSTTVPVATSSAAIAAVTTSVAATASVTSVQATAVDVGQLLTAYSNGYQFTTTLTVGSAIAATFQGRRVANVTALLITQNGISIDEIITATGAWIRQPGQSWTEVPAPAATSDPLAALRSPTRLNAQGDGTITATYPAQSFGLPAGDLAVVLTPASGRLAKLRYSTTVSGKPAVLETTFSALADTTPITAPV